MAFDTSSNRRVIYAQQALGLGDMGATSVVDSWGTGDALLNGSGKIMIMHGVQRVGVNTNFNLQAIKELGQLSLYENVEDVPDVEVTVERFLDGYTMAYHAASATATDPTLTGRQNARCDARMVVGLDTDSAVSSGDNLAAELYCSGMYTGSYSLSLPTDGTFSESLTLVGNNKKWLGTGAAQLLLGASNSVNSSFGSIFGNDSPQSPDGGVLQRNNFVTGTGITTYGGNGFVTVLPSFINGISNNGSTITGANGYTRFVNCGTLNTSSCHIQNISFSVDLGRESINQLGTLAPYYRYVNFPVNVTTEIEVIATAGDNIDAVESVPSSGNLSSHTIQVVLDDSTVIQVGNKNKLTSITYGGGDADGGNATIRYSMVNSNDFVVLHSGDPMPLETGAYFKYWF